MILNIYNINLRINLWNIRYISIKYALIFELKGNFI